MDKRKITQILLQAQKDNERYVTGIIGKTDDADETTIYANAEKTEVWVRVNGVAEPYRALIGNPSAIVPRGRVRLEYDIEASRWVVAGVNASANSYAFQHIGGFNFAIQPHNHATDSSGGDLGPDTVGASQVIDGSITGTEIASATIQNANMAANSIDSDQYVDGSIDTAHYADDSIVPTKTDGLTGASVAFVTQTASNTFSSIDYDVSSNRSLMYDGSSIRPAYYFSRINSGSFTTSNTTPSVVEVSDDMASIANLTTLRLRMQTSIMLSSTGTGGNYFRFMWQYNYDNSGAEGWQDYWYQQFFFGTGPFNLPKTFTCIFYGATMTTPDWGYSSTNKVRLIVFRTSGSDNLTIHSGAKGGFLKTTTFEELQQ